MKDYIVSFILLFDINDDLSAGLVLMLTCILIMLLFYHNFSNSRCREEGTFS